MEKVISGSIVKYHGEYETCCGFIYKVTKVYNDCGGPYYDLELFGGFPIEDSIFKLMHSVKFYEIELYDPIKEYEIN